MRNTRACHCAILSPHTSCVVALVDVQGVSLLSSSVTHPIPISLFDHPKTPLACPKLFVRDENQFCYRIRKTSVPVPPLGLSTAHFRMLGGFLVSVSAISPSSPTNAQVKRTSYRPIVLLEFVDCVAINKRHMQSAKRSPYITKGLEERLSCVHSFQSFCHSIQTRPSGLKQRTRRVRPGASSFGMQKKKTLDRTSSAFESLLRAENVPKAVGRRLRKSLPVTRAD